VLHIVGSFHQGGSEYQAVQLIRLLREEGSFRILTACLNRSGPLLNEIAELDALEVPEFPLTSFYDRNFIRQIRAFSRFVRKNNISVLQTHDFYTNVFGMAAGVVSGVPLRIAAKRETGMRSFPQRFIERRAFNLAHRIVVNAGTVKRYLVDSGVPQGKIVTIHNGLDPLRVGPPGKARRAILDEFGLPNASGARYVTILANLRSHVKNHRMFLHAAKIASELVPDANFIVAGEGELMAETRELAAKLGITERTFFIGRCTNVADLLSITDVGVLSSVSEGFPNSILEYMAASVPVVAAAVGGVAEAVADQETGFLVEMNDHIAMADRIIEVLKDTSKAASMGQRGRERVDKYFTLENQLNKTLQLYGA